MSMINCKRGMKKGKVILVCNIGWLIYWFSKIRWFIVSVRFLSLCLEIIFVVEKHLWLLIVHGWYKMSKQKIYIYKYILFCLFIFIFIFGYYMCVCMYVYWFEGSLWSFPRTRMPFVLVITTDLDAVYGHSHGPGCSLRSYPGPLL